MNYLALWFSLWIAAPVPQPRPDLTPAAVVRTVVNALQNCNSPIPNAGIFTAYRFASPANHAVTGPYGHFLGLVKSSDFEALRRPYRFDTSALVRHGDYSEQIVTVHVSPGHNAAFKFSLSLQKAGRYRGCWMVDGVDKEPSLVPGV